MSQSKKRSEVVLFFTGGTICMRPTEQDRGLVPSGDFQRLLEELRKEHLGDVHLRPVLWSDLPSPAMTPENMFNLSMDVNRVLAEPNVKGAVVVHGTDTLAESAFMADLLVIEPKPVVFTGAMRFYSETGFDGIRNLINAIYACLQPLPPETGVVLQMADLIFQAREVTKVNSLNVNAFEAPGTGAIGYVVGDTVILTRPPAKRLGPDRTLFAKPALEPHVPLISCFTGMDGSIIELIRSQGLAGLVIAGFGAGNVPPGVVPSLEALVKDNIPVVLTTQCLEGGVWPVYGYPGGGEDLHRRGVIMGGRLSAAKARLQLMVALGVTRDMNTIREIFNSGD
jgi:L-asparaginase